ncbi:hypothetical protein Tco_0180652 [Tanacetum coccineum]
MIVSTPMIFSSDNSTEYLVSTVDGTMPLKGINSMDVRLLSDRFYILVIIVSLALTSSSLEVSLERKSHDLQDSNSLKGKAGISLLKHWHGSKRRAMALQRPCKGARRDLHATQ